MPARQTTEKGKEGKKMKAAAVTTRSAAAKKERKAGAASKKKTRVLVQGSRSSLRLKEQAQRERVAGAGLGLGLVLGGVGGWAVGRSMSASDLRYLRQLEARNRYLEQQLAGRR